MNIDDEIEIEKKREYMVVKGNDLVQKSRFELSLAEQKTVAYICSMIKPIDAIDRAKGTPFKLDYIFNIQDYCNICGIDYENGQNYIDIKATLKKLSDRSMWLKKSNQEEVLVRWLTKVHVNSRSGKIKIILDEDLVPYLFDLKEKFTQYQLHNILAMKSAFSVRFYELMKSYQFQHSKTFDIDELKQLLMVQHIKSYVNYKDFRVNVLEKVEKEINELTDIFITFEPIKKGRKVVKIRFDIRSKDVIAQTESFYRTKEILNKS